MKKGTEEIQAIMPSALTMNVAMLRQHDQFANKQEPLAEKEAGLVRSHPAHAVDILRQAGISHPEWVSYVRLLSGLVVCFAIG